MEERYYEYVPITDREVQEANVYAKTQYRKNFYRKAAISSLLSIAALLFLKILFNKTPILLFLCFGLAILNMIQAFIALHQQKTCLITRHDLIFNLIEQRLPQVTISLGTGIIIQRKEISNKDVGQANALLQSLENSYGKRNTFDYIHTFLSSQKKEMYATGVIYLCLINEAVSSGQNQVLDAGESFIQYIEMEEI